MSTHNLCFEQKYEKYHNFCLEIFPFLVIQFSIYLNRHVFVMDCPNVQADMDFVPFYNIICSKDSFCLQS